MTPAEIDMMRRAIDKARNEARQEALDEARRIAILYTSGSDTLVSVAAAHGIAYKISLLKKKKATKHVLTEWK